MTSSENEITTAPEGENPAERGPKKLGLLALASDTFLRDFKALLSLSPVTLGVLADKVKKTPSGLHYDDDVLKEIVESTEADASTIADGVSVASHLFRRAQNGEIETPDLLSELAAYCAKHQLEGFAERRDLIGTLIEAKPEHITARRRELHEGGVLYTLGSVSAVHELRAVFNDDGEWIDWTPMVLVRLILEDDRKDSENVSVAFQVTKEGLTKLRDRIQEYVDKLVSLPRPATEDDVDARDESDE